MYLGLKIKPSRKEVKHMDEIIRVLRKEVDNKGLKWKKVSVATNIPYQRLNRILNQGASMSATELIAICDFLDIDPNIFKKTA